MSLPTIATRDDWLVARKELLAKEKEPDPAAGRAQHRRQTCRWSRSRSTTTSTARSARCGSSTSSRTEPQLDHLPLHVPPRVGGGLLQLHRRHRRDIARLPGAPARPRHHLRHGLPAPLAKVQRWKAERAWISPGTPRTGPTSTTTSVSPSTCPEASTTTTTARLDEYAAMGQESMKTSEQPYDMPGQSCFLQVDDRIFTPTRSTPRPQVNGRAPTTSSTSPPSAAKRTGKSRRTAASLLGSATSRLLHPEFQ